MGLLLKWSLPHTVTRSITDAIVCSHDSTHAVSNLEPDTRTFTAADATTNSSADNGTEPYPHSAPNCFQDSVSDNTAFFQTKSTAYSPSIAKPI